MSRDDEQFLKFGREVVRMIHDLQRAKPTAYACYVRRRLAFPGGEVHMLLTESREVGNAMEDGVRDRFNVQDATPASEVM